MKVKITQEHINQGVPGNDYKCPVALALNEKLSPPDNIKISVDRFILVDIIDKSSQLTANLKRVKLSKRAKIFILQYDLGVKVKPITLGLPIKTLEKIIAKSNTTTL